MSDAMKSGTMAIYSLGSLYPRSAPRTRNLGSAIVMAAIADYRSRDDNAHRDAAQFLYPKTAAARRHYEWAVALNDEVNPAWLRESLDRWRPVWDAERQRTTQKRRRDGHEKRMGLGKRRLQDWGTHATGAVVEPAHAASVAGTHEAAPGV